MNNNYPELICREAKKIKENGFALHFHNGGPTKSYLYHFHDYYEINLYLGPKNVNYIADNIIYPIKCGDIILTNIFMPHYYQCFDSNEYTRFSIGVDTNYLLRYSTTKTNLIELFKLKTHSPVFPVHYESLQLLTQLIHYWERTKNYIDNVLIEDSLIHLFLATMYNECNNQDHQISSEKSNNIHYKTIAEIINYIEKNLNKKITLEEIAKSVNYSPQYITRLFKSITRYSIFEYIIYKRISLAKKLLLTNESFNNISTEVGFNNYSYFYKAFKKQIGVSPEKYKKMQDSLKEDA